MKPISLKISGLNSFIEPVTIDFTLLTERGIFGIFGPTGSGKSTILDAMTLALYGDIPRNTKNYINTNSKSATVSYEFQISGKEVRRYKVEREFKRNKSNGNANSGKARLLDITDVETILEENVTNINEACKEIIGLSKEDFTRTVVLPQGKFSEFLKLEGKDKHIMLERLFNLQQYGDELIIKVNKQSAELKSQKDNLKGYLASYGDLQQVDVKMLEEEIREEEQSCNHLKKQLEEDEIKFENLKNQWEKQKELETKVSEKLKLEENKEEYNNLELSIEKAKQAKIHIPYIKNYENLVVEKEQLEHKERDYEQKLNNINEQEKVAKENQTKLEQEKKFKHENVKEKEITVKSLTVNFEGRNYLQEGESLKARIKLGNETIQGEESLKNQYEINLKIYEEKEKIFEKNTAILNDSLEDVESKLTAIENKKEQVQKSKMAIAMSQELHQGDDCPICGNKIQILVAKSEDKALEHIENEKKKLQLYKIKVEQELGKIKQEQAKLKGQNENWKESLDKTVENLKKYKLALEDREQNYFEMLELAAKELDYKGDVKSWDSGAALDQIRKKESQKLKEDNILEELRKDYEKAEQYYIKSNLVYQKTLLEKTKLETTTIEIGKNLNELRGKLEKSKEDIEESFKLKFNLVDITKTKQDFIKDEILESMEKKLVDYKNQLEQLTGIIKNFKTQIKTVIKEEEYQEELIQLNLSKLRLNQGREKIILNQEKLDQTQKRINEQKEALVNYEKVEKRLSLVDELKKLFGGKRFVSYVARNQLIYIAREASRRLMDITGGSYEIQVDDDGKFQILDYKNGASVREVSSLSGGEVFIASLALALALAAHIQLKGANLELFFLDEGFGTLDEDLLEVVMTSIEKIKSDKMAIGLISHVESIKQRVPVKLIVTPAESGGIGSTVKIEY